jgi:ABC-2 type transport system ATP-binding protein
MLPDMIEANSLTKRYGGRTAVRDVSFRCEPGTVTGFLGPNGAGKSTTLKMLCGMAAPTSGQATVLGTPFAEIANPGRHVGVLIDASAQHSGRRGGEVLATSAQLMGVDHKRVGEMLELVGLDGSAARKRVGKYSLGMRQRLGVARCLLADPQLLILDEPTNGLDPGGIQEFRQMIRSFVDEEGRTVFLSSHLLDEVERVCDAAAIVDRGRVVTQGPIAELAGAGIGAANRLLLGVDDRDRALAALQASDLVAAVRPQEGALEVTLAGPPESAAQLNALLVGAGVGVMRLEPVRHSLEQRFLEITARLDGATPDPLPATLDGQEARI